MGSKPSSVPESSDETLVPETIISVPKNPKKFITAEIKSYIDEMLEKRFIDDREISTSRISEKAIEDYVDKYLSDPDVNHGYIAETVEGIIYRKVLKTILHSISKASDNLELDFIGHKIRFYIVPIEQNREFHLEEETL